MTICGQADGTPGKKCALTIITIGDVK